MVFFDRYMGLVNSPEYTYLGKNEPFSTLKDIICTKFSFHQLTQFSQINSMRDALASNTDGSSFERYMSFFNLAEYIYLQQNETFSYLKTEFQDVFVSKTNSILQVNKVLDTAASKKDGYLCRDTCVSSTDMKRPLEGIRPYLRHEIPKLQQVLVS